MAESDPANDGRPAAKKLGMGDPGQRNIVIAWIIGMAVIGLACWVIAHLIIGLQPRPAPPAIPGASGQ